MLDNASSRVRQAMSLPNILFGVEEEEAEKLIDKEPSLVTNGKKEKKKWYNRLPNPGQLLSPLRDSLLKLKRKHDHYETTDHSETSNDRAVNVTSSNDETLKEKNNAELKDNHEQYNYLSEMKLSLSDKNIRYFIDEKLSPKEAGLESFSKLVDEDVNRKSLTVEEQFAEARAILHRRVTVSDIFCGRYRKL